MYLTVTLTAFVRCCSCDWKSRWFSDREYKQYLTEDWQIRDSVMERLETAAISRIEIERTRDKLRVDIHTARPGIVIGRKGAQADELRQMITKILLHLRHLLAHLQKTPVIRRVSQSLQPNGATEGPHIQVYRML